MFKFLDPLRYLIYKQEAKKVLLTPQEKQFVQLDKARRILLLFKSDETEQNNYIKRFIEKMTAKNIKVISYCYVDKKQAVSASLKDFHIIDNSTCSILGRPSNQVLELAKEHPVDVVIDLCEELCLPLRYILLHSTSAMKVGKQIVEDNVLDLMISPQQIQQQTNDEQEELPIQNESFLLEQIEKYLTMIGTKEA